MVIHRSDKRIWALDALPVGRDLVRAPAEIPPRGERERIWTIQKPLDFPRTVFGLEHAALERIKKHLQAIA